MNRHLINKVVREICSTDAVKLDSHNSGLMEAISKSKNIFADTCIEIVLCSTVPNIGQWNSE